MQADSPDIDNMIMQAAERLPKLGKKVIAHPDLPNPFVPASNDVFREQYYWDSFFIMQGLAHGDGEERNIARCMVENFFFLFQKHKCIPNSHVRYTYRTQPPLLTSMILLVHRMFGSNEWLDKAFGIAKDEYSGVWMFPPRITPTWLSRYYDPLHPDGEADDGEDESGWDFTPRFENSVHTVCPVDLNAMLCKYEIDFAHMATILGRNEEAQSWTRKAAERTALINKYMWNEEQGIYFDYDFTEDRMLKTKTLAAFVPLWAKIATARQAAKLAENLRLFEHDYGLAVCDHDYGFSDKQWNFPNGWAPLHWLVVSGLRNYGFHRDADRISQKWLGLCAGNFLRHGTWDEKYSVISGVPRADDLRYGHQKETYWTLGVFISLLNQWKSNGAPDYTTSTL